MRQLADALGCSPKTPYRYFKDKADILATVRAQAFEKFSDALEAAVTNAPSDPVSKAQAVGEAYHRFAMKNPHAYRIMFDIEAPIDDSHPELGPKARHAATYITSTAERLAKAGVDRCRSHAVRLVDVGGHARAGDVAAGRHAGTCSRLPDAGPVPRRADAEGSGARSSGQEAREEAMTAGVTAGERFRSWADIQANAARGAGGFAALGLGEDDSVALMLRNDFPTFEVNMAAGQLGIYAVPINWHFTPEEAGYILADSGAKVLVAHSDLLAQIASGVPAQREGAGRADARGDRCRLQRAGREAAWRPPGVETWDAFVAPQRAQHRAAQGGARQHDLHLGHDRPAQGRAPPAVLARAAGAGRRRGRQVLGHQARSLDRRADERPDVSLGARRLRHGQRAARPQHGAAAALRGRGHAAPDRPPQGQPHAHRADHVRAPAAPARRGEAALRSLLAALDHPWRRTLRAGGEAPDDRLVGTGHQRVLRRHRDRHRGLARFASRRSPSPAPWATSSRAPRCASSTSRAAT